MARAAFSLLLQADVSRILAYRIAHPEYWFVEFEPEARRNQLEGAALSMHEVAGG
jgi:hypothetical protein